MDDTHNMLNQILCDSSLHPLTRLFLLIRIESMLYSEKDEVKHRIWQHIEENINSKGDNK